MRIFVGEGEITRRQIIAKLPLVLSVVGYDYTQFFEIELTF